MPLLETDRSSGNTKNMNKMVLIWTSHPPPIKYNNRMPAFVIKDALNVSKNLLINMKKNWKCIYTYVYIHIISFGKYCNA